MTFRRFLRWSKSGVRESVATRLAETLPANLGDDRVGSGVPRRLWHQILLVNPNELTCSARSAASAAGQERLRTLAFADTWTCESSPRGALIDLLEYPIPYGSRA
jgi:hypothetical protein